MMGYSQKTHLVFGYLLRADIGNELTLVIPDEPEEYRGSNRERTVELIELMAKHDLKLISANVDDTFFYLGRVLAVSEDARWEVPEVNGSWTLAHLSNQDEEVRDAIGEIAALLPDPKWDDPPLLHIFLQIQ